MILQTVVGLDHTRSSALCGHGVTAHRVDLGGGATLSGMIGLRRSRHADRRHRRMDRYIGLEHVHASPLVLFNGRIAHAHGS